MSKYEKAIETLFGQRSRDGSHTRRLITEVIQFAINEATAALRKERDELREKANNSLRAANYAEAARKKWADRSIEDARETLALRETVRALRDVLEVALNGFHQIQQASLFEDMDELIETTIPNMADKSGNRIRAALASLGSQSSPPSLGSPNPLS